MQEQKTSQQFDLNVKLTIIHYYMVKILLKERIIDEITIRYPIILNLIKAIFSLATITMFDVIIKNLATKLANI